MPLSVVLEVMVVLFGKPRVSTPSTCVRPLLLGHDGEMLEDFPEFEELELIGADREDRHTGLSGADSSGGGGAVVIDGSSLRQGDKWHLMRCEPSVEES